jgi:uncharacterized protein VirK/YbjX
MCRFSSQILIKMKSEDKEIFESLQYNDYKKYWFYIVPTSVRRIGQMKINDKKYRELKKQYEMLSQNGT